jgi:hypothetical protein
MESVVDQLVTFGTAYGLKIIGAILLLILGRIAAGLARKMVKRMLDRAKTDKPMISQISRSDKWKDPEGVISAYKRVREKVDCRLVMSGGCGGGTIPRGPGFTRDPTRRLGT